MRKQMNIGGYFKYFNLKRKHTAIANTKDDPLDEAVSDYNENIALRKRYTKRTLNEDKQSKDQPNQLNSSANSTENSHLSSSENRNRSQATSQPKASFFREMYKFGKKMYETGKQQIKVIAIKFKIVLKRANLSNIGILFNKGSRLVNMQRDNQVKELQEKIHKKTSEIFVMLNTVKQDDINRYIITHGEHPYNQIMQQIKSLMIHSNDLNDPMSGSDKFSSNTFEVIAKIQEILEEINPNHTEDSKWAKKTAALFIYVLIIEKKGITNYKRPFDTKSLSVIMYLQAKTSLNYFTEYTNCTATKDYFKSYKNLNDINLINKSALISDIKCALVTKLIYTTEENDILFTKQSIDQQKPINFLEEQLKGILSQELLSIIKDINFLNDISKDTDFINYLRLLLTEKCKPNSNDNLVNQSLVLTHYVAAQSDIGPLCRDIMLKLDVSYNSILKGVTEKEDNSKKQKPEDSIGKKLVDLIDPIENSSFFELARIAWLKLAPKIVKDSINGVQNVLNGANKIIVNEAAIQALRQKHYDDKALADALKNQILKQEGFHSFKTEYHSFENSVLSDDGQSVTKGTPKADEEFESFRSEEK